MNHTNDPELFNFLTERTKNTFILLYALIFLFGCIGNLMVMFVYALNSQMRDTTNTLILNLAISDFLFLLVCLPETAKQLYDSTFIGGEWFCSFTYYFQYVSAMCSVWTLVFMALDRFLAVVYPFFAIQVRKLNNAIAMCIGLWVTALLVYIPMFTLATMFRYELEGEAKQICVAKIDMPTSSIPFYIVFILNGTFVAFVYGLPLSITCILYSVMISKLWKNPFRKSNKDKPAAYRRKDSGENIRAKKKITIMVLSVTVIYAICWAPQSVRYVNKIYSYHAPKEAQSTEPASVWLAWLGYTWFLLSILMTYFNSCLNPLLYALLSENFRKGVLNVFRILLRKNPTPVLPEIRPCRKSLASGKPPPHRIRRMTRPQIDIDVAGVGTSLFANGAGPSSRRQSARNDPTVHELMLHQNATAAKDEKAARTISIESSPTIVHKYRTSYSIDSEKNHRCDISVERNCAPKYDNTNAQHYEIDCNETVWV